MAGVSLLPFLAAAANGLLAGVSFEVATVKLPARHRIGSVPYAQFARGADLGNGKAVYPALAIVAALLTFGATIIVYWSGGASALKLLLLALASAGTVLHFATTAKAAPIMLSIGRTPDDERVLADKLDRFARWSSVRAALQGVTFLLVLWAVAT
jgi:Zn-dependent protease with chaperone function